MRIKTATTRTPLRLSDYEPPNGILVDEHVSLLGRGRDRGDFYILVEVSGDQAGRNVVAMQLASAVRDAYLSGKGSITSGLQQAISTANKLLFDENRNSLPGEEWAAGVSCAVLRDDDLFLAQAGPAAAYLLQGRELIRFPEQSAWLDDGVSMAEMDSAALGSQREVAVALFHTQIKRGDTLLLAESALARRVSTKSWTALLGQQSIDVVPEALSQKAQTRDLSALIVRFGAEQEAVTRSAGEPQAKPLPAQSPVLDSNGPPPQPTIPWAEQLRLGERIRAITGGVGAAVGALGAGLVSLLKGMMPGQPSHIPSTKETNAAVTGKKTLREPAKGRPASGPSSGISRKTLTGLAIAIPVIIALVVLVVYLQRGQAQKAELDQMRQEAVIRWEQASEATDPAVARTLLEEAQTYLQDLREDRPGDAEANELWTKVEARLDAINQVRRINWIAPLTTYPSGAKLTRVVVEGTHVFVMDQRAGTVYHHQMDDYQKSLREETKDTILVKKGEEIGGILVNDLIDMTWMPVGAERQKADLLILESNGALIEYDPATGTRTLRPVASSDQWQYPTHVGSYFGRFYLLDPTANKIWRYSPVANGYSAPPDEWLQNPVDLTGVVDMAIGNSIYLAYTDGKIRKLTLGLPDTFDISDWDSPPQNPGAIFTRPPEATRWVYLADRGNQRIVRCSKEGQFDRQYKLAETALEDGKDPMGQITSLFIDEISSHAYFLSGQTLYLAILPN